MEKFKLLVLGKKYYTLKNINEQAKYLTISFIFMLAIIPLVILGVTLIGIDPTRVMIDFGFAAFLFLNIILLRSKIPNKVIAVYSVTLFGLYCLYLLSTGTLYLWVSVWGLFFPLIAIFLMGMKIGITESIIYLIASIILLFAPFSPVNYGSDIGIRYVMGYFLGMGLTIVYEIISIVKDKKEKLLTIDLNREKDTIQTMKDNLNQGIFLIDKELKILSNYSKPLKTILSYYDEDLEGKNFLDIISGSLEKRELEIMKKYFKLIFNKSRNEALLEESNPISEFEYKIDNRSKILKTRFSIIEQEGAEAVIIGILQDITKEKEFEDDLKAQKELQEVEIKNMFDVIQIEPVVFQDFIEDTDKNFNFINNILKDQTQTEKQVVTKFFQNIHAIKSNALILGLENFGQQLHNLEDEIKVILDKSPIESSDILHLTLQLEMIMREKDAYTKMMSKLETFRSTHKSDTILISSLNKAIEKLSAETGKKVKLDIKELDLEILKTDLRKPIKEILFQCVRNSFIHGIDLPDKRVIMSKDPIGKLRIILKQVNDTIVLEYSDDGNGLNWQKIGDKFKKVFPNRPVDRKQLLSAIFNPEFSTSSEVSTIAGRGVGLSLVKDLVTENKGKISVNSSEKGLTFKFVFPC